VFSTISPLHLDDRFRELKRRLIAIPCKRVEELSEVRQAELGIIHDSWQQSLLNLDAYSWKGFSDKFQSYWDLDKAQEFIETRKKLTQSQVGLSSQQLAISFDLLTTGIVCGIWENQEQAVNRLKIYWKWFKHETEEGGSLGQLLVNFLNAEVKNAQKSGRSPELAYTGLRYQIKIWVEMGWIIEAPKGKEVSELMYDNGWRFRQGKWCKD
jgi:hypothetical protein